MADELPIRQLLLRLANRLPKRERYYVVRHYAGDPQQTIIANNLAEAYVLYYDYENLTSKLDIGMNYQLFQDIYDENVAEGDTVNITPDGDITVEWLNSFNDNDTEWLEETNHLPVIITRESNEQLKYDKEYGIGSFVKSATKR